MTPKRKTGLFLVAAAAALFVVIILIPGGFAFDYPVFYVASVVMLIAGVILLLVGGRRPSVSRKPVA